LTGYVIGSNGIIYGPQGGLRINMIELSAHLMMLANGGKHNGKQVISEEAAKLMLTPHWTFNGTNGDTLGNSIQ